jgi:serine/threonine-protein kinase ATR
LEPQEATSSEQLYERLQDIYSQIDEPDGIEGISSHLSALSIDQQVLEHRKAGRWATAQSWYELELEKEPENIDAQWNLVTCLKTQLLPDSRSSSNTNPLPLGFYHLRLKLHG